MYLENRILKISDIFFLKNLSDIFNMRFSRYMFDSLLFYKEPSGDGEIRTLDPLLARQVLSQLSYTPTDAGPACSGFTNLRF